jgi:hypothetical protein
MADTISIRVYKETIDDLKSRYPELTPAEAIKCLLKQPQEQQQPEQPEKQVIVEKVVTKISDKDLEAIKAIAGELANVTQLVSLQLFLAAGLLKKEDVLAILSTAKVYGVPAGAE